MSYIPKRIEDQIAIVLRKGSSSFRQVSRGSWSLNVVNGKSLPLSARLAGGWFCLDASVSEDEARENFWRLLQMNESLTGLCKFALMPNQVSIHLRGELPVAIDDFDQSESCDQTVSDCGERVREMLAGMKSGFASSCALDAEKSLGKRSESSGDGATDSEALRKVCAETGWPFVDRSPGTKLVELDSQIGFHQAAVRQIGAGVNVSAEVLKSENLGSASRQALSVFLLTASCRVRLVRPVVEEQANKVCARFEASFATTPSVGELKHALSALSVAIGICGREATALQDETIARHYLASTEASDFGGREQMFRVAD